MDVAELAVRESVRDLVARYNAYGDTGRLDEVAGLFIDDGVLVVGDHDGRREFRGRAAIADFLRTVKDHWAAEATADSAPSYARHFVSTHVIDILDDRRARGRAYVALVKAAGRVSWGRYVDEYVADDGVWRFASRRALADTASAAAGAVARSCPTSCRSCWGRWRLAIRFGRPAVSPTTRRTGPVFPGRRIEGAPPSRRCSLGSTSWHRRWSGGSRRSLSMTSALSGSSTSTTSRSTAASARWSASGSSGSTTQPG